MKKSKKMLSLLSLSLAIGLGLMAGAYAEGELVLPSDKTADQKMDGSHKELMVAVQSGYTKDLNELLQLGVNPNIRFQDGNTPLTTAIINGSFDKVKLLLQFGANPNEKSAQGHFPIECAMGLCDSEYSGPKLISAGSPTPSSGDVVAALLEFGANPNVELNNGETPLTLAVSEDLIQVAKKLLEFGANPNEENSKAETPLDLASGPIVAELLRSGANSESE